MVSYSSFPYFIMPRQKRQRSSSTRRNVRRKITRRPRRNVKALVVRQIRRMQEKKSVKTYTTLAASSAWAVADMSGLSQGDTNSTREGNYVKPLALYIKGILTYADNFNGIRLVVTQTKTRGHTVAVGDAPTFGAVDQQWMTPFNRQLYTVMYDKVHFVQADTGATGGGLSFEKIIKMYLTGWKAIKYDGATTTAVNSGIHIWVCSDSAAAPHPSFNYYSSFKFVES